MVKKNKILIISLIIIFIIVIAIIGMIVFYNVSLKPVSNTSEDVTVTIEKGATATSFSGSEESIAESFSTSSLAFGCS